MGSYNNICAVSKTVIKPNQKARLFFLVENVSNSYISKPKNLYDSSFSGISLYSWSHFKIIGYPLSVTYNDCNLYTFENKKLTELTLNKIRKIYQKNIISKGKENYYNEVYDYMEIDSIENVEQLQRMIRSGALRVKTDYGTAILNVMVVHEDIYQDLILKENEFYINFIKKEFNENIKKKNIEDHLSSLGKITIENIKKLIKSNPNIDIEKENKELEKIKHELVSYKGQDVEDFLIETNFVSDIYQDFFLKETIIKSYTELLATAKWFDKNAYQFLPSMVYQEEFYREEEIERLEKIFNIIKNIT